MNLRRNFTSEAQLQHFHSDDGRILTPPKELGLLLKDSFAAFSRLLGHIRFFYMADEIWDGKSLLTFNAGGVQLTAITLDDGVFYVHIKDEDFRIEDESLLNSVFEVLKKNVPIGWHRPFEQLTSNPDPNIYACGYRCDMCLVNKKYNENDFSGSEKFSYMDSICYHDARQERNNHNRYVCLGCNLTNNKFCRSSACSKERGYVNCAECGDYHSCDIFRDSHYAGQCNLGITAEEVTNLVIPYCMKERLDIIRNSKV